MSARHVVYLSLLLAPSVVAGQATDGWRDHFAAGEQARRDGDAPTYRSEMAAAAGAMPEGLLNRPFVQYHAARAAALEGRGDEAVAWLRRAWEEDIEALMISYATYDPAFDGIRDTEGYRGVMGLPGEMTLTTRPLGGSVYLVQGAGANVLVQIGGDGALLIDTGYAPALPALRRALASLGADGVDVLVVTHPHEDHMGSAAELGRDARVLAHPGTGAAMREPYVFIEGVSVPPKAPTAWPDREVANDTTFRFNGEDVRIVPTVAHSEGDISVYFAEAHVADLGDAYLGGNPMMYPGGDDPDAFLDRMEAFLDAMDPATVIVGGHEEPVGIAAVRDQIATTRACMSLVRSAIAEGLTADETVERAAGRYPPQWIGFFHRLFTPEPRTR